MFYSESTAKSSSSSPPLEIVEDEAEVETIENNQPDQSSQVSSGFHPAVGTMLSAQQLNNLRQFTQNQNLLQGWFSIFNLWSLILILK